MRASFDGMRTLCRNLQECMYEEWIWRKRVNVVEYLSAYLCRTFGLGDVFWDKKPVVLRTFVGLLRKEKRAFFVWVQLPRLHTTRGCLAVGGCRRRRYGSLPYRRPPSPSFVRRKKRLLRVVEWWWLWFVSRQRHFLYVLSFSFINNNNSRYKGISLSLEAVL